MMQSYWFATQDPKVFEYQPAGLWVLDKFKRMHSDLQIKKDDWVAIYEPKEDRDRTRKDGARAVIALAKISKVFSTWQPADDFWKIAAVDLVYKNQKGVPSATAVRIITGDPNITGNGIGWYLNRRYAGRVTAIEKEQFYSIAKYFTSDDLDEHHQEVETAKELQNPPQNPRDPRYEERGGGRQLVVDRSLAKYCISRASFMCGVDSNHMTFISKVSGNKYVESHHLIPLKAQPFYDKALDNQANIIALCPNCHRLMHHATEAEKSKYLAKLLSNARTTELNKLGTPVTFQELLKYYD